MKTTWHCCTLLLRSIWNWTPITRSGINWGQKDILKNFSFTYQSIRRLSTSMQVLVFCITARITAFMYTLYKELGLNCLEIHSKKSQMHRFHTYKDFRDSDGSLVMFTSNVSSRGLNYPNVTLVVQVNILYCFYILIRIFLI